eukprot:2185724-Pleurochrysis_carterae.AAC.2
MGSESEGDVRAAPAAAAAQGREVQARAARCGERHADPEDVPRYLYPDRQTRRRALCFGLTQSALLRTAHFDGTLLLSR